MRLLLLLLLTLTRSPVALLKLVSQLEHEVLHRLVEAPEQRQVRTDDLQIAETGEKKGSQEEEEASELTMRDYDENPQQLDFVSFCILLRPFLAV